MLTGKPTIPYASGFSSKDRKSGLHEGVDVRSGGQIAAMEEDDQGTIGWLSDGRKWIQNLSNTEDVLLRELEVKKGHYASHQIGNQMFGLSPKQVAVNEEIDTLLSQPPYSILSFKYDEDSVKIFFLWNESFLTDKWLQSKVQNHFQYSPKDIALLVRRCKTYLRYHGVESDSVLDQQMLDVMANGLDLRTKKDLSKFVITAALAQRKNKIRQRVEQEKKMDSRIREIIRTKPFAYLPFRNDEVVLFAFWLSGASEMEVAQAGFYLKIDPDRVVAKCLNELESRNIEPVSSDSVSIDDVYLLSPRSTTMSSTFVPSDAPPSKVKTGLLRQKDGRNVLVITRKEALAELLDNADVVVHRGQAA